MTPRDPTDVAPGEVRSARLGDLSARQFHDIARLRSEVFVVEQDCPYLDLDGRDAEAATVHLWIADPADRAVAACRVLDDGADRRIGRVVTHPDHRGRGLAAALIGHALATTTGPWVLAAQAHLARWYAGFGFEVVGPEFDEDGIPHLPMRRDA